VKSKRTLDNENSALFDCTAINCIVGKIVDSSHGIQYKLFTLAHVFPLCNMHYTLPLLFSTPLSFLVADKALKYEVWICIVVTGIDYYFSTFDRCSQINKKMKSCKVITLMATDPRGSLQ